MSDLLTPEEFEQQHRPLLDRLHPVNKPAYQQFLNEQVRFPFSVRRLTNKSEWYLYWRSQDVLAAACQNAMVNGQFVRGTATFVE